MDWNDQNVAILETMWEAGKTATDIGTRLGVSRGAVLGKLHRLREERKTKKAKPPKMRAHVNTNAISAARVRGRGQSNDGSGGGPQIIQRMKAPKIERDPLGKIKEPHPPKITEIEGLNETTCRWPIGEVCNEGFGYCGDHPKDGKPYCGFHCAVAYTTQSQKQEESREYQQAQRALKRENPRAFR